MHGGKVLLVKRSQEPNLYPGYWNGISGFLDDQRSLEERVREELAEETGLTEKSITEVKLCGIFDQEAPDVGKTWIVHAVMARSASLAITLDWEAQAYAWVDLTDVHDYKLLPGFDEVLAAVSAELGRRDSL